MNAKPCAPAHALVPCLKGWWWTAIATLMSLGLASVQSQAAPTARPAVDLLVQVRMIDEADWAADPTRASAPASAAPRTLSSSTPTATSIPTQALRVQNGERAAMSWSQALPIQWTQAASYRGSSTRRNGEAGFVNALVWLQAGQSLSVQPRWPGGQHPVRVELRLEVDSLGEPQSTHVPSTQHQASSSTLSVPLGQWTTFAATGTESPSSSPYTWSTQSQRGRRLMQLRVTPD